MAPIVPVGAAAVMVANLQRYLVAVVVDGFAGLRRWLVLPRGSQVRERFGGCREGRAGRGGVV